MLRYLTQYEGTYLEFATDTAEAPMRFFPRVGFQIPCCWEEGGKFSGASKYGENPVSQEPNVLESEVGKRRSLWQDDHQGTFA